MASSALLDWHDPFSLLQTKDAAKFDKVFKPAQEETVGLELVRAANAQRLTSACKHGLNADGLPDQAFADRLLVYLGELEAMVTKVEGDGSVTPLVTQWTSPLGGKPSHFHRLTGLAAELAMAASLYAAALRSLAAALLLQSTPSPGADAAAPDSSAAAAASTSAPSSSQQQQQGEGPNVAAQASTLLRKAAGVYQWLQDRGIPRAAAKIPASERPAELSLGIAKVMTQVCLAEAQAVAAWRAEQRGVTPALLAALHAGAWELWEGCAKTLKAITAEVVSISDHLRRYIACSSAVCRARALRALAVELRDNKEQAGQAEAACLHAASLLQAANVAADLHASWRRLGAAESAVLEETRKKCEKERVQVLYQSIAKAPPELPPGKVLNGAVAFVLEPPASALQQAAQQEGSALNQLVTAGAEGSASPPPGLLGGAAAGSPGAPGTLTSPVGRGSSSALTSALDHSLSIRDKKS